MNYSADAEGRCDGLTTRDGQTDEDFAGLGDLVRR